MPSAMCLSQNLLRGADKSLTRPDWKNNWKVAIFRPTRRSLLPWRPGWMDKGLIFFFFSGLQKLEFGRCSFFPSWSGYGLISTPVYNRMILFGSCSSWHTQYEVGWTPELVWGLETCISRSAALFTSHSSPFTAGPTTTECAKIMLPYFGANEGSFYYFNMNNRRFLDF